MNGFLIFSYTSRENWFSSKWYKITWETYLSYHRNIVSRETNAVFNLVEVHFLYFAKAWIKIMNKIFCFYLQGFIQPQLFTGYEKEHSKH